MIFPYILSKFCILHNKKICDTLNYMKIIDVIFALVCGRIIGFLLGDFLREWGIGIGLYWTIVIWFALPFIALFCLWVAYLIGKKVLFVFQGAKFLLVGAVATILDLKFFELLVWIISFIFPVGWVYSKSISFLVSTALKYWGNKYWAFCQHEKEDWHKELLHFFFITLMGLIIDVVAFYYFTKALGPQLDLSIAIWTKVSVILAAIVASIWNFLGYKLLVFKK